MKNLTERQKQLKEQFVKDRGFWSEEFLGELLKLDPDYFEAYINFSAVPWKTGVLPPKIKELIYVAMNASSTHLYADGIRVHMRNALKYGATKEEIMEVFELVSVLGIHSCILGVPILVDELKKQNRVQSTKSKE